MITLASVAQLVAFGKACSKAGYAGLAIGGKTNFQASWMFDSMMPTAVTAKALNNYINSYKPDVPVTARWTDPGILKTLDALDGGVAVIVAQTSTVTSTVDSVNASLAPVRNFAESI